MIHKLFNRRILKITCVAVGLLFSNHLIYAAANPAAKAPSSTEKAGAKVGFYKSSAADLPNAAYTITSSVVGSGGKILPAGASSVTSGSDKSYSITPISAQYYIADVVVDGSSVGPVASYTFTNVSRPHTIQASFTDKKSNLITSAVNGIGGIINPMGAQKVDLGADKSFVIRPNTNYCVVDVLVDGVSVGPVSNYNFTQVTKPHTITAKFSPITNNIYSSVNGYGGQISPSGTQPINCMANKNYTVTPIDGFHIADVLVDGVSVGPVSSYTFSSVSQPHTISATFSNDPNNTVTSSIIGIGGTVEPLGPQLVRVGADQSFTILPERGYRIADVLVDGTSVGTVSSYLFTNITKPHTITAKFSHGINSITSSVVGLGGTITPTGLKLVNYGTDQNYTITPSSSSPGNYISDVVVDGASVGPINSYTFNNVTQSHTISASFSSSTSNIITSSVIGIGGRISPAGARKVGLAADQSYVILPDRDYYIADVIVDGVSVGAITNYSFTDVLKPHTILAKFSPVTNNIYSSVNGYGGQITPSGTSSIKYGSDINYTISTFSSFHISDVVVDGVSVGPVSSYTFINVTQPHTILAKFSASRSNNILSAVTSFGGTIDPFGTREVELGADKSYAILPDREHFIADVLVDGISANAISNYTFSQVVKPHVITAKFSNSTNTITSSVIGFGGKITPVGATSVRYWTDQNYAITPSSSSPGNYISDVVVDGNSVGPIGSYTFTDVNLPHLILAFFSSSSSNPITATVVGIGGAIHPSGTQPVKVMADSNYSIQPDRDHYVADVEVDGVSVGAITSYTFNRVTRPHTIRARFSPVSNNIFSSVLSYGGDITPAGITSVNYDRDQNFTITPLSGFYISDVIVDGVSVGPITSYAFFNVNAPHTIVAKFSSSSDSKNRQ